MFSFCAIDFASRAVSSIVARFEHALWQTTHPSLRRSPNRERNARIAHYLGLFLKCDPAGS